MPQSSSLPTYLSAVFTARSHSSFAQSYLNIFSLAISIFSRVYKVGLDFGIPETKVKGKDRPSPWASVMAVTTTVPFFRAVTVPSLSTDKISGSLLSKRTFSASKSSKAHPALLLIRSRSFHLGVSRKTLFPWLFRCRSLGYSTFCSPPFSRKSYMVEKTEGYGSKGTCL